MRTKKKADNSTSLESSSSRRSRYGRVHSDTNLDKRQKRKTDKMVLSFIFVFESRIFIMKLFNNVHFFQMLFT
jgi:hypothetical protein